jgi:hypothetical protein
MFIEEVIFLLPLSVMILGALHAAKHAEDDK